MADIYYDLTQDGAALQRIINAAEKEPGEREKAIKDLGDTLRSIMSGNGTRSEEASAATYPFLSLGDFYQSGGSASSAFTSMLSRIDALSDPDSDMNVGGISRYSGRLLAKISGVPFYVKNIVLSNSQYVMLQTIEGCINVDNGQLVRDDKMWRKATRKCVGTVRGSWAIVAPSPATEGSSGDSNAAIQSSSKNLLAEPYVNAGNYYSTGSVDGVPEYITGRVLVETFSGYKTSEVVEMLQRVTSMATGDSAQRIIRIRLNNEEFSGVSDEGEWVRLTSPRGSEDATLAERVEALEALLSLR